MARALSPRIQANGRWIAVNARRRRAYSITGKEPGSPLLAALANGTASGNAVIDRARSALGLEDEAPGQGYVGWFRVLNEGYPFLDYSKASTQKIDIELMGAYAATEPPPPVSTAWPGKRLTLPFGRLEPDACAQLPTLNLMAAWLRLSAGATHTAQIRHSTATYKTSPSGGARHPTDLGVSLGAAWPDVSRGGWWYDGIAHELAKGGVPPSSLSASSDPRSVVFTISSHVRRAMWRYRDARAVRPIAIDAGHVVETLIAVIRASGWHAWWEPAPGFAQAADDLDPVFGYVLATPEGSCPQREPAPLLVRKAEGVGHFRTNPFLSLRPASDGIVAENHAWPDASLSVSPSMIEALAWSTPSSRDDRPTSSRDLLERYLSEAEFTALIECGLLISKDEGDRLWSGANPWFEHDWYLSLLALACEGQYIEEDRVRRAAPPNGPGQCLAKALDLRRTTRAFSPLSLPPARAEIVLELLHQTPPELEIVITAFGPFGSLAKGVYGVPANGIVPLGLELPSEDQVRTAAIGQAWARDFAAIIWVLPRPGGRAGDWISAFVEAGRLAQRVALALCDDEEIGVFQSPALVDEVMPSLLGDAASIDGAYMIGLGRVSGQGRGPLPGDKSRHFLPSDLIAPRTQ